MDGSTILICGAIWAVLGAIGTAYMWERKQRDPMTGAMIGAVLGFLGGIILLAPLWILVPAAGKQCPRCAEKVRKEAQVCKHCGYDFTTGYTGYTGSPSEKPPW